MDGGAITLLKPSSAADLYNSSIFVWRIQLLLLLLVVVVKVRIMCYVAIAKR